MVVFACVPWMATCTGRALIGLGGLSLSEGRMNKGNKNILEGPDGVGELRVDTLCKYMKWSKKLNIL